MLFKSCKKSKRRKYSIYKRTCIHCGRSFLGPAKRGTVCPDCRIPRGYSLEQWKKIKRTCE